MENPLDTQGLLLAATLLAGLGLGALYDLLRVFRERAPAVLGVLADICFCLVFALALFTLGMGPARGNLRLYMPLLVLCGAGLWFFFFGSAARRAFRRIFDLLHCVFGLVRPPLRRVRELFRRLEKKLKKHFSFVREWFTITASHRRRAKGAAGERNDETEAYQYLYEDCDRGADRIRGGHAGQSSEKHRGGGGRPGGTGG